LKNPLKRKSIGVQLLTLCIFIGLVMLAIVFIFYFQVSSMIAKSNSQYANQIFLQVKQSITSESERIDNVLQSITFNDQVQSFMIETDRSKKYEKFKTVDKLINNTIQINKGIIDFAIIDNSESYFFEGSRSASMEAVIKNLPKNSNNYFSQKYTFDIKGVPTNCFLIVSAVHSIDQNTYLQDLGKVVIVLDANAMGLNMDKSIGLGGTDFVLLDRKENVYSSNNKSLDKTFDIKKFAGYAPGNYSVVSGKMKYIINMASIPQINGKIASIVSENKLFHDLDWIRSLTMIILFLAAVMIVFPFVIILNNILKPMKKFMKFIASVKTRESFKDNISLEGYKEIEIMSSEFNNLLNKIDNITIQLVDTNTRLYEAELEQKESELSYLKSQINPHFLYNTLETMKGCAVEENAPKTMSMAKALGRIFRYSVKGADIVLLREELDVIKSYVHIQEIRFGDRLQITYDFTGEALECKIPKIILQPIVENAIGHGLETKLGKGHLLISGRLDDKGDLIICVTDNGNGMSEDTLQQIKLCLSQSGNIQKSSIISSVGIGMVNVNRRIKLNYGMAYGLEIKSELNKGTEVTIRIPAKDQFTKDEPQPT
jgi:two-component system sensor histidine kinase YesM